MQWQPDTAFLQGLDFFSGAVAELGDAAWQRTSPCADWRALDVLGHVGQATRFGTLLLPGAPPAWAPVEPPGGAVDGTPGESWEQLADQARTAVADLSRVLDSPRGQRSIAEGLSFPALDLPAGAIEFARAVVEPLPAGQVRNPQIFAAEKPAPPGATDSQALIAWTGRDPDWTA
jgi:hypothetical protein